MLYLRMLAELEHGQGAFVYVNVLGGPRADIPAPLKRQATAVTVSIALSLDGKHVVRITEGAPDDSTRGVFVELLAQTRNPGQMPAQERLNALEDAVRRLPQLLMRVLPEALLKAVSLICFDEVHRLRDEEEVRFFCESVPLFETGGADIVIATQVFPLVAYVRGHYAGVVFPRVLADRPSVKFNLEIAPLRNHRVPYALIDAHTVSSPPAEACDDSIEAIACAVSGRLGNRSNPEVPSRSYRMGFSHYLMKWVLRLRDDERLGRTSLRAQRRLPASRVRVVS